jgi:hypothetical protein
MEAKLKIWIGNKINLKIFETMYPVTPSHWPELSGMGSLR